MPPSGGDLHAFLEDLHRNQLNDRQSKAIERIVKLEHGLRQI